MENSNCTITKRSEAPELKLEVAGYIAYDTAGYFEKELIESFQDGPDSITVDMDKVVVFTSIGIRVILKAYKLSKEKGVEFQIENPSDIVRNVMELSNLGALMLKK